MGSVALDAYDRAERRIEVVPALTLTPLWVAPGHTGGVWGVALSADGRLVASGGFDGTVRLWEATTGTSLRTLRADRRYERLDTTGLTGITAAQRAALLALGAVEHEGIDIERPAQA